ncbi:MAG: SIS domain-containing protein [Ignavibacteriaceae bacterium]|nr:SIS domain-containing protein [Ignavibacteriaceae bacterium]
MNFSEKYLSESLAIIRGINTDDIESIAGIIASVRSNNGRLFIIGSGGGAGHASHAVCDFRKLCNIEAYAPYDNISELTARVNDEGWDVTILNWLKVSKFNKNDGIFVFSVGGGSQEKSISMNLVKVVNYAKEIGAKVVGVVGRDGGFTKSQGDAVVVIPVIESGRITPHTEGFQAVIWHLLVSHPKLQLNNAKWESVK